MILSTRDAVSPNRVGLKICAGALLLLLASASNLPGQNFGEDFDGVVAPNLPAGWTSINAEPLWVTSGVTPDTPPNDAFVNDADHVTDKRLDSSPIVLPVGGAQLTFRNTFDTEANLDGGVLEISIAGSFFQDVVSAGGNFVSGGYNGAIPAASNNPLAGRSVWTGNSGGYTTTVVNLPPAAAGQSIQLRWRMGTDSSNSAGFTGWRIDTISVPNASFSENFDGVTPPALPAGWTGGEVFWVTDTTNPDTTPNDAHADEVLYASDRQLISPSIAVPAGGTATLTFHHSYDTETDSDYPDRALDFGTLEISIAGGPFQDILAAGGAFVAGGYDKAGNTVWGGTTDGVYVTTIVTLPPSANGMNVRLSWRFVTDNFDDGFFNDGWRIDTVTLVTCPPTAVATAASPTICPNASTTLSGSGGDSCLWSPATWLSNPKACNPTVTPNGSSGVVTYTLTATNSQCPPGSNTSTATVTVTSTAPPTAVASASQTSICPGSSTTLSGSGGDSCFWTPSRWLSNPNVCNPTVTPTGSGSVTYTLKVQSSVCGLQSTNNPTVTITVTAQPDGPPINAPAQAVAGQAGLVASIVTPNPGSTYVWTFVPPGSAIVTSQGPSSIVFTALFVPLTLNVTERIGTCVSNPTSAVIDATPVCVDPQQPPTALIQAAGNPDGPVTGIDYLNLSWTAPEPPPSLYLWSLNGALPQEETTTSVPNQPPTGNNNSITLQVRGACSDSVFSDATTYTVSPSPPVAQFSVAPSVGVGIPVTFTDTSDPDATSWLWLFGDGTDASTDQSVTHTFASVGTYTVWLFASNGAGSSSTSQQIEVTSDAAPVVRLVTQSRLFDASNPWRQRLASIDLSRAGRRWLHIQSQSQEQTETILFLRFLDPTGAVALERRLSVSPGQDAAFDLTAYGLEGTYDIELVSLRLVTASIVQPPDRKPRQVRREQR